MGRGGSRKIWSRVLFAAALLVTVAAAAALLLACLSMYVNPNRMWSLSFFGLMAPFIYLANAVLLLCWTIRWSPVAFVPLAALLIGFGNVKTFFKPSLRKEHRAESSPKAIRVLDYNVFGFMTRENKTRVRYNFKEMAGFIADTDPDIICMQEFQTKLDFPEDSIAACLDKYPYRSIYYKIPNSLGQGFGIAVFSKYPIVRRANIDFGEETSNSSQWVDLRIGRDTVRVINNHLQSTHLNESDRSLLDPEHIALQSATEGQIRQIGSKLKRNYARRAFQADTIASIVESAPYPVILCGDFNDTPVSYTYRKIRGRLEDSFAEKGRGFHYTYKEFFRMLRIDYIFHSGQFETVSFSSPNEPWSDHLPIIVELQMKK